MLHQVLSAPEWLVTESGFDAQTANRYESLFTVGNGRLGTRGSLEEGHQGELAGTYLAGVYDSHDAAVIDLVNVANWLSFAVWVDGVRLDVLSCRVLDHERALDLRQGVLWRSTLFEDGRGRRTRIESLRLASMHDRHLCALRVAITAENYNGQIVVESSLEGNVRNLDRLPVYAEGSSFDPEVKWQKWALSQHLTAVEPRSFADGVYLESRTIASGIGIGFAAATASSELPVDRLSVEQGYQRIGQRLEFTVAEGQTLRLDKLVTSFTTREVSDVAGSCLDLLDRHLDGGFDDCLTDHQAAWERLWADCDCRIIGDPAANLAVRFGIYQLLIAANGDDPTVNIGAKSLSGEGYRGHVFWDTEVLMLPFFVFTQPQTARSLLRYRHHTLPAARELAREGGQRGARYPWEAADTGREECPMWTNDGLHRFWTRDEEIHVSADVTYGIWSYLTATADLDFLLDYGAEIIFETSRFWTDRVEQTADGGYSIKQVMGPDEFHSHVDDNAFTNRLAQWSLHLAVEVYSELLQEHPARLAELVARIGLEAIEVERWRSVADGIRFGLDPEQPVIEQFAGYFDRVDVSIDSWDDNDMPRYPAGYHHFNCEDTMLLKQPDVIMLMHMLPDDFDRETKLANFEFYEARTLHKSSLSPAIHAIMGIEVGDASRALQYFRRSAFVDLADNQGNTQEGIHIASAGGTWQVLVNGFGGFRVRHDQPAFDPWLPPEWDAIGFRIRWRGLAIDVTVEHGSATFRLDAPPGTRQEILVVGRSLTLLAGEPAQVAIPDHTSASLSG